MSFSARSAAADRADKRRSARLDADQSRAGASDFDRQQTAGVTDEKGLNMFHTASKSPIRGMVRIIIGLSAAFGLIVGLAPVAMAAASSSAIVKTGTTRAAEAFFNRSVAGSHGGRAWIDLYDAKCDAHSVYVQYRINGGGTQRFTNSGGCYTTSGVNLQAGYFAIIYRACVDVQGGTDPCSVWVSDHN